MDVALGEGVVECEAKVDMIQWQARDMGRYERIEKQRIECVRGERERERGTGNLLVLDFALDARVADGLLGALGEALVLRHLIRDRSLSSSLFTLALVSFAIFTTSDTSKRIPSVSGKLLQKQEGA